MDNIWAQEIRNQSSKPKAVRVNWQHPPLRTNHNPPHHPHTHASKANGLIPKASTYKTGRAKQLSVEPHQTASILRPPTLLEESRKVTTTVTQGALQPPVSTHPPHPSHRIASQLGHNCLNFQPASTN